MSNASDRAYQHLRALIIAGDLAPGTQLKEEQVAELCGVSRTPVRNAMHRLEAEMFIERTESQRSFVAHWSDADVADLFSLRTLLEGYAAEQAVSNMTDAMIERLQDNCDRTALAINAPTPDTDVFLKENAAFHGLILEAAGSDRLASMLRRLVLVPLVQRTALHYDRHQLARSLAEHRELVAAFKACDPEWAKSIMTGHIRRAYHVYKDSRG
ncbi:MAG: GntR family transcriptional regulator [bacterium]|nr:GntR family transcriptional regulator [bacterium]